MPEVIMFGKSRIARRGPCYVIAEIGHNHQGDAGIARKMIGMAAAAGADAVKFQKRNNRRLFTGEMYDSPYENENSYGRTYGLHRDNLELTEEELRHLQAYAREQGIEFLCTPFDEESLDFLERLGVPAYKFASGDITNTPLLRKAAALGKPLFLSTGASTLEEIHIAYDAVREFHDKICLMHCVSEYPSEYEHLNLDFIKVLKAGFPEALIGYSSHDNGILASSIAYGMGAVVVEKHFTHNRAAKGTDHAFSLEPDGLRKQIRDLKRLDVMMGDGKKIVHDYEKPARMKMGKGLYAARPLLAGHVLAEDDISVKSPAGFFPPYRMADLIGRKLKCDMQVDEPFGSGCIAASGESEKEEGKKASACQPD